MQTALKPLFFIYGVMCWALFFFKMEIQTSLWEKPVLPADIVYTPLHVSNGTLTKVATTANDGNIRKGASNGIREFAFVAPYNVVPGVYFVCMLYNQSAQTTAPALGTGTATNNAAMVSGDLSNGAKLFFTINTQNTMPSTITISSTTASSVGNWVGVY